MMTQQLIKEIGLKQFLKSRSTGLLIGTIIGLLWMLYAASLINPPLNIVIGTLSLAITVSLILKIRVIRRKQKILDKPSPEEKVINKKKRRYFILNFIIEIALLNICYYYLTKYDLTSILLFSISIIVGLHFIPMAVFLKVKQYFICSFIMVFSGIVFILIAGNEKNIDLQIAQIIICGIALWLTVGLSIKDIFVNDFYLNQK